jgi:membrane-associated phospholipid phosphatase
VAMALEQLESKSRWAHIRKNISLLDVTAMAYLAYYFVRLLCAPANVHRTLALPVFGGGLLAFSLMLLLTRGDFIGNKRTSGLIYRMGLFLTLLCTYIFGFKNALMGLGLTLLDPQLTQIDQALFGCIPAVWFSQSPSLFAVEWFSFFYYLHFVVVTVALVPTVVRGQGSAHLSRLIGGFFVIVIGWISYSFVPGLGPYQTMTFSQPLVGGFWFGLTMETVQMAGPQIDVFPSLHSAFTLFVGLHCFRFRESPYMRWVSCLCLFVAINIILATLYLRFHYAIDVLVGIALAAGASVWAPHYYQRISSRRQLENRQILFGYPLDYAGNLHDHIPDGDTPLSPDSH